MGGLFGTASTKDCVNDLFFGIDYHSHLGTHRGGMAVSGPSGFQRAIHNIQNSPFRTKFERDVQEMKGCIGIGCISDTDPQPIIVRARFGSFVLSTVGKINNADDILDSIFDKNHAHFQEQTNGTVSQTEVAAALIATQPSLEEGLALVQDTVDGSLTMLAMTEDAIYAARDKYGRTPLIIGKKEDGGQAYAVSFESFAYQNLGYVDEKIIGPSEIVKITPEKLETLREPGEKMKICSFLWTYYGYPTSSYEGVNVEQMRNRCGEQLAKRDQDEIELDYVAGVPDSGTAHAIGYANTSKTRFARPLIKYTPTWPRSFMPPNQSMREMIAKMKLITVNPLINGKKLLFIDDSIVRGTQMHDTASYLFEHGAQEVHVRSACPPIMYACKYLNFSRSTSEYDLITRRVIRELEDSDNVPEDVIAEYADASTDRHHKMLDRIAEELDFTSLKYHELEDLKEAVGIDPCKLCTYCWDGKE
ncbi:MAG: amidophosphoribosyltransferase [Eubacteriaceae bacterium]|jgi:amidophosphoribosyltransferase